MERWGKVAKCGYLCYTIVIKIRMRSFLNGEIMKELFLHAARLLQEDRDLILVTVLMNNGSTPRGAGARMLVYGENRYEGTIGGGMVEYLAQQKALQLLREHRSLEKSYQLGAAKDSETGMICGGNIQVYFQFISGNDGKAQALFERLAEIWNHCENGYFILEMKRNDEWEMGLCENGRFSGIQTFDMDGIRRTRTTYQETEGRKLFIEPLIIPGKVYVFGAGHVAQATVPVLRRVGFSCVVVDDRQELLREELFPDAERLVCCEYENVGDYIELHGNDYAVIMTRGHRYDYEMQVFALKSAPFYIGVMGSRRKIAIMTEKLLKEGFSMEEIQSCHMPIGMEIKADTPEEIAVSVAGELIRERAGRYGRRAENGSKIHS